MACYRKITENGELFNYGIIAYITNVENIRVILLYFTAKDETCMVNEHFFPLLYSQGTAPEEAYMVSAFGGPG